MPALVNRRANSYFVHNNDGTIHEYNCFTCSHEGEIVVIQKGHEAGINWDFCMKCMKPICLKCARKMVKTGECDVLEKVLLRMERLQSHFAPGAQKIDRDIAILLNSR